MSQQNQGIKDGLAAIALTGESMDKLKFQQILTLIVFFICGVGLVTRPDITERWLGMLFTMVAYWMPAPSTKTP
jgi:hypothetical protein